MGFCNWISRTLSDPNDDQGSTQRLCLLIVVTTTSVGFTALAIANGEPPEPGENLVGLIKFMVTAMVGGIGWSRGIAFITRRKRHTTRGEGER